MFRLRHAVQRSRVAARAAWTRYRQRPENDLSPISMDAEHSLIRVFLYCLNGSK
ncbi:MAG TPA: hypothetical protein VIM92_11740 [Rhodanobacteraceae bacterium]